MKLGVVGMPNVGKSTLFNAITQAGAASENYPFCTIEPNVGMVSVPDARLDYLAEIHHPKKFTPATIEFVDIAGLVKGASKGEGLGNKFLSHIREVDAIVHVVRCFEDENITHVDGKVDPVRDMETISFELIFADMESVEKRLTRAEKMQKSGDKKYVQEAAALKKLYAALEAGKPARTVPLEESEQALLRDLFLLTDKPIIYVANISEEELGTPISDLPLVMQLKARLEQENAQLLVISAKVEEELSMLEPEEKQLFMQELGIAQSGLDQLVQESYSLLGLISFLTAGEDEVRAWTITRGTKAPQAAGKIHTDFERGFIKAEVIAFDALKELGGDMLAAKEKGLVRQEGKEYVMQDGDVVLFKFNV
ncbi:MAG: redox-regulated ATPase YchF [Clostridiales bacterium]|nr:redox-regulated ATPase YchF [Clostridiales bacterium]